MNLCDPNGIYRIVNVQIAVPADSPIEDIDAELEAIFSTLQENEYVCIKDFEYDTLYSTLVRVGDEPWDCEAFSVPIMDEFEEPELFQGEPVYSRAGHQFALREVAA